MAAGCGQPPTRLRRQVGNAVGEKPSAAMALTGRQKRRVLVFVHGFNTRFTDAALRFAQIAHDTNSGAAPILFSWPSRGGLLNYSYDKESANFSRGDLAYVLRTAADSPAVAEVTVLAHSMGAWLAMEALRQVALEDNSDLAKINNIVLASPDIDVDVFRRQLDDIGAQRPLITVFTSSRDRALGISSVVAGGVTRVGGVHVEDATYQREVRRRAGVSLHRHQSFAAGRRPQSQHLRDESEDRPADWRALAGWTADHRQRPGQPSRCRRNARKRRSELRRNPISHSQRGCCSVTIAYCDANFDEMCSTGN